MSIRIIVFSDGLLLGFTYYPASNLNDFNEFNIYLIFFRITIKWI